MNIVKYETVGENAFHIPEGLYTIKQLEMILAELKQMDKRMSNHLMNSIKPTKEKK